MSVLSLAKSARKPAHPSSLLQDAASGSSKLVIACVPLKPTDPVVDEASQLFSSNEPKDRNPETKERDSSATSPEPGKLERDDRKLQVIKVPSDQDSLGVVSTLADGRPLPEELYERESLLLRVFDSNPHMSLNSISHTRRNRCPDRSTRATVCRRVPRRSGRTRSHLDRPDFVPFTSCPFLVLHGSDHPRPRLGPPPRRSRTAPDSPSRDVALDLDDPARLCNSTRSPLRPQTSIPALPSLGHFRLFRSRQSLPLTPRFSFNLDHAL